MKSLYMRDCAGWYLEFMDEMREFATQPADLETLEAIKSRFKNALLQVDELIKGENKIQLSDWCADTIVRHEGIFAGPKFFKPKARKTIARKLKRLLSKAGKISLVSDHKAWADQFSIEIKLGDRVVFAHTTPEKGSPYGAATTDVQTNLRIKEILQHALDFVNTSLGGDGRNFKS